MSRQITELGIWEAKGQWLKSLKKSNAKTQTQKVVDKNTKLKV